jgi:type IV secretion system protein TrbI
MIGRRELVLGAAALAATWRGADAQTLGQQGRQNGYAQFGGQGADNRSDRWRNNQPMDYQRTPYTLRTGAVLPAIMLTPVNSDLPGQILSQVSQNVYDTATGQYLLIPQGCRLVGTYSSDVAYGQSRILCAWQRIVFPDARALDIGAMPGADGAGVAGLGDQVNNHYLRVFGSALLLSGITAGFKMALPDDSQATVGQQRSLSKSVGDAVAENLGQTANEMIRKNMTIAPTLEVRAGFRINVMVVKDLEFDRPYRAFEPG